MSGNTRARYRKAHQISPRTLVAYSVALAYGGGGWLHLLHQTDEAGRIGPPGVVRWLRDSTLALPLVVVAVWLGLRLACNLRAASGQAVSELVASATTALLVAVSTSLVMGAGDPVHGWLFPDEHTHLATLAGEDLPWLVHAARDGVLALLANVPIAMYVACLVGAGETPRRLTATHGALTGSGR